ncbi:MAG: Holliday junction resolvase RuvX [Gammaproteobacteria bacterium]|nr:Holliday junction resolvase RuvX [Gammaproteobacteria bacterium]
MSALDGERQKTISLAKQLNTFMGFDIGRKRTGIAYWTKYLQRAKPLKTLSMVHLHSYLKKLIDEWQPDGLVIGVPYYPDGNDNENTQFCIHFGHQLTQSYQLPVFAVDERYSTVEAKSRNWQADQDSLSASILLEQFWHMVQGG